MKFEINFEGNTIEEVYGVTHSELYAITQNFLLQVEKGTEQYEEYDQYLLMLTMIGACKDASQFVGAKLLGKDAFIKAFTTSIPTFVYALLPYKQKVIELLSASYFAFCVQRRQL